MKPIAWFCISTGLLLAQNPGGLRPKAAASEYPGHGSAKGVAVGATAIPKDQVSKRFATDLNRGGYIVLEVALYPEGGTELDLKTGDFLLSAGSDPATVRAVSPQAIAAALQRKNAPKPHSPGDVTLYPTATIGYESVGYGNGNGSNQRHGGVYGAAGVGVGIGDPGPVPAPPGSTDMDRSTMRQELEDKGLPEIKTTTPVAGYLYFPRPASARGPYKLTYYAPEGQTTLTIPK